MAKVNLTQEELQEMLREVAMNAAQETAATILQEHAQVTGAQDRIQRVVNGQQELLTQILQKFGEMNQRVVAQESAIKPVDIIKGLLDTPVEEPSKISGLDAFMVALGISEAPKPKTVKEQILDFLKTPDQKKSEDAKDSFTSAFKDFFTKMKGEQAPTTPPKVCGCGNKNSSDDSFCAKCGAPLDEASVAQVLGTAGILGLVTLGIGYFFGGRSSTPALPPARLEIPEAEIRRMMDNR